MTGLKTAIPLNLFTMKLRINPPPLENNDIGSMNDKATTSVLQLKVYTKRVIVHFQW